MPRTGAVKDREWSRGRGRRTRMEIFAIVVPDDDIAVSLDTVTRMRAQIARRPP